MLWIAGTSVSIEHDGYAARLSRRARQDMDIATGNLSVGDQTSIMGCMRVLANLDRMQSGDVLIWEYSLLDTLLAGEWFPAEDVHAARRLAWRKLVRAGIHVLVLLVPPRDAVDQRSACEKRIIAEAEAFGLLTVDLRNHFAEACVGDPAGHYRDDRHPLPSSPAVESLVLKLLQWVHDCHGSVADSGRVLPEAGVEMSWCWRGAAALASANERTLQTLRNALVDVQAVTLPVDDRIKMPPASRVIGICMASTHRSGGLWCGHPGCAPAATRLPDELEYKFLLRSSGLPCVHASLDTIAAAPDWAYARGVWAAYGQALSREPGEVIVLGVLFQPVPRAGPTRSATGRLASALRRRVSRGFRFSA